MRQAQYDIWIACSIYLKRRYAIIAPPNEEVRRKSWLRKLNLEGME
jgi:hypothetical protein